MRRVGYLIAAHIERRHSGKHGCTPLVGGKATQMIQRQPVSGFIRRKIVIELAGFHGSNGNAAVAVEIKIRRTGVQGRVDVTAEEHQRKNSQQPKDRVEYEASNDAR